MGDLCDGENGGKSLHLALTQDIQHKEMETGKQKASLPYLWQQMR